VAKISSANNIDIYMINKINIILYVGDQAKSREFYAIILGKAPRLDVPGMTEFELSDTCILGLMPEKGIKRLLPAMPDPETAGGIPRAEVYLTVPDPEVYHVRALAAGARAAQGLGAQSLLLPGPGRTRARFCRAALNLFTVFQNFL